MSRTSKLFLLLIGIAGIGTAGYFFMRKTDARLKSEIIAKIPAQDRPHFSAILDKMTRQELLDVHRAIMIPENLPQSEVAKIDPAFKMRVAVISNKYNIFT